MRATSDHVARKHETPGLAGAPVVARPQATLRQAEAADHAKQVAQDPDAKLTPKHVRRAEQRLEDLAPRHRALSAACEASTTELIAVAEEESEALIAAARESRRGAVEQVAAAAERIAAEVDGLQRALSIARRSSAPESRRWKFNLGSAHVGKRHGGIPVAELIDGLRELADVLSQQPTPGEEQPQPEIHFGWSRAGAPTAPPGAQAS
jgi:hypothetical protein